MPRDLPRPRRLPWLEIGVAVGIVAILATALGITLWIQNVNRCRTARRDVERLWQACEEYMLEAEVTYPVPDADPTENWEIHAQVQQLPAGGTGQPLVFWPQIRTNAVGSVVDPWGTPYRFKWGWRTRRVGRRALMDCPYRIYSCGPNRNDEDGEGDDIVMEKFFPLGPPER